MRSLSTYLLLAVLIGLAPIAGCSNTSTLSAEQLAKLDPPLQRLVRGEKVGTPALQAETRGDSTVYAVLISARDPEELREHGIPIDRVLGEVITARLTVDELRRAASLPTVRAISLPDKRSPNQP